MLNLLFPVSPRVAMFLSNQGSAAPEGDEHGDGVPQQEDAMIDDLIIGEHEGSDDVAVCKPCDDDVPLVGSPSQRVALPAGVHSRPVGQSLLDSPPASCWMPILRNGQTT